MGTSYVDGSDSYLLGNNFQDSTFGVGSRRSGHPGREPSLKPEASKSFAGPGPLPLKTKLLADPHVLG
jgi:hypothetical protein